MPIKSSTYKSHPVFTKARQLFDLLRTWGCIHFRQCQRYDLWLFAMLSISEIDEFIRNFVLNTTSPSKLLLSSYWVSYKNSCIH